MQKDELVEGECKNDVVTPLPACDASIIAQVLSMNPLNVACNIMEEAMRNICNRCRTSA